MRVTSVAAASVKSTVCPTLSPEQVTHLVEAEPSKASAIRLAVFEFVQVVVMVAPDVETCDEKKYSSISKICASQPVLSCAAMRSLQRVDEGRQDCALADDVSDASSASLQYPMPISYTVDD